MREACRRAREIAAISMRERICRFALRRAGLLSQQARLVVDGRERRGCLRQSRAASNIEAPSYFKRRAIEAAISLFLLFFVRGTKNLHDETRPNTRALSGYVGRVSQRTEPSSSACKQAMADDFTRQGRKRARARGACLATCRRGCVPAGSRRAGRRAFRIAAAVRQLEDGFMPYLLPSLFSTCNRCIYQRPSTLLHGGRLTEPLFHFHMKMTLFTRKSRISLYSA